MYTHRYLPDVTGDGLVSQVNNPEVEVDIAKPDVRTRQLIMELRVGTNKLRHAQSGQDIDFMDSKRYYNYVFLCSLTRMQKCMTCTVCGLFGGTYTYRNLLFPVPGEEGSGSGGGDHGERYNDDWPGYGPYSPPHNNPPRNPASNPAKPPRVRERNGSKWNRNNGRARSTSSQLTSSLFPLFSLPFMVTLAPMWR